MTGDKLNIESGTYPEPIDATGKDRRLFRDQAPAALV